jgi:hypothetical protein
MFVEGCLVAKVTTKVAPNQLFQQLFGFSGLARYRQIRLSAAPTVGGSLDPPGWPLP